MGLITHTSSPREVSLGGSQAIRACHRQDHNSGKILHKYIWYIVRRAGTYNHNIQNQQHWSLRVLSVFRSAASVVRGQNYGCNCGFVWRSICWRTVISLSMGYDTTGTMSGNSNVITLTISIKQLPAFLMSILPKATFDYFDFLFLWYR